MSENPSVLRLQEGELQWLCAGDAGARPLADPAVAAQLRERLAGRRHPVLFAAPGADLRLQELPVTRAERRHLAAALPYTLEDSLGEDIDALHFARCDLAADRVGVAVVRRSCMDAWREQLADWPALRSWVPEALLLPWQPGQWTLVFAGEEVLLRHGRCWGATLERALLPALLEALAAEQAPQSLVLYGSDEAAERALLPAALRDGAQWRRGGLAAALLLSDPAEPRPQLLQGDYAPRLPYERWWRQWRRVAALLLAALCLQLLSGWLDLRRLQRENIALRSEIQAIYRSVNPRGAVVDAEKQLRRQLQDSGGGDSGAAFSALLAPLGELVAGQEGATLASLNFNRRSGQLRVNLLAANFGAVERIRAGLSAAGLAATLENSSRAGDQVRARLRIEAGA